MAIVLSMSASSGGGSGRFFEGGRRSGAGLLFAALAGVLWLTPAASAKPSPTQMPTTFWGVSPQLERPQEDYLTMKRGGVDSVRFPIPWDAVERQRGVYDFSLIDRYVGRAATAGLEIFPGVNATPTFYGDDFRTLPSQTAEQRAAWQAFLRALVRRYGPDGDFWSQNPQISPRPIRIWQIWNEPNFFYFTEPRSPQLYADLVKISHAAIKGQDPGALIVLAGLFGHPRQQPPQAYQATDFLDLVYQVDGIKDFFDGVALHPYALDASELRGDIKEIREVMSRNGDEKTGLYLTELGWGDGTDTGFEKGPEGQLEEMTEAFTIIGDMQRSARIQRIFWFAWEDARSCNFCDSVGLYTEAGQPKPAWYRYVSFSGCFGRFTTVLGSAAAETLTGSPGDDVIVAGGGDDVIDGGGGNDRICAEDGDDSIVGGAARDLISGGPGNDVIRAGGGPDRVFGDPGDDRILAGPGNDRVFGDLGIDRIFGGGGADLLAGDGGGDFLFGGGGRDRLLGYGGNDSLFGNQGNDTLFGGTGKDRLFGQAGNDKLNGGAGRDLLRPGPGTDRVKQ